MHYEVFKIYWKVQETIKKVKKNADFKVVSQANTNKKERSKECTLRSRSPIFENGAHLRLYFYFKELSCGKLGKALGSR